MQLKMSFIDYIITPFAWLLRAFYNLGGNYVLALLLFAIVFKIILLPSSISQQKGMAKQQRLQPKVRRIQAKFAGDQKKIQEETQALYQREGYNPMNAGCLPMLIQLPIIYVLYEVIYNPLKYVLRIDSGVLDALKKAAQGLSDKTIASRLLEQSVIKNFDQIKGVISDGTVLQRIEQFIDKFTLFGISLGEQPEFSTLKNWASADKGAKLLLLIPLISGLTSLLTGIITFVRQKQTNPEMAKNPTSGCMTFMMPLMSVYFTFLFPAGIGLYWIFQNILSAIQMVILNHTYSNEKVMARMMVAETIERRSKEANDKLISRGK
ncbi:MAG: YidC/Oxa1 family membrane protein insertase [Clostridia bacterium]|nr:YidC/Oxa1 family membrane protein insertase [Clostridia bacterium]